MQSILKKGGSHRRFEILFDGFVIVQRAALVEFFAAEENAGDAVIVIAVRERHAFALLDPFHFRVTLSGVLRTECFHSFARLTAVGTAVQIKNR